MNPHILAPEVQDYIDEHLHADINTIALAKSPFVAVSAAELATQIASKKKASSKLPTWFNAKNIYYPPALSIEQTSSETTAFGKSALAIGDSLIDLTAGFGVDSFYFAKKLKTVVSCEINRELSEISAHNAIVLGASNIECISEDGLAYLQNSHGFDNIYLDPARRSTSGKVFKLADCTPNVIAHLDLLFGKAQRIIIKTSPLLDLKAGLSELRNVSEIHIESVKNECKELVWVLEKEVKETRIICTTYNETIKTTSFSISDLKAEPIALQSEIKSYLYEPDAAIMKSGAFNWISKKFDLEKLSTQTHLYTSDQVKEAFPGRIFKVNKITKLTELKKAKELKGNVLVRNFPERADHLVRKYKIIPSKEEFILFTKKRNELVVIFSTILQYY